MSNAGQTNVKIALLLAASSLWSCTKDQDDAGQTPQVAQPASTPSAAAPSPASSAPEVLPAVQVPSPFAWAEVLDLNPDPKVVTDADFLQRIAATGLPWRVRDKKTGIEFLLVPPGTFVMGLSPGDAEGQSSEKPDHQVTITKPFYLGSTEVTQEQWERVTNTNPSAYFGASMPVHQVSFHDLEMFLKMSDLRLPTEAEWEYACRAGVSEPRYGDLDQIALYEKNSAEQPNLVGEKAANALGFHDMLGNVMEWCSDWYTAEYYAQCKNGVTDPMGPSSGTVRVSRGGSWAGLAKTCRASYRFGIGPDYQGDYFGDGFRAARTP